MVTKLDRLLCAVDGSHSAEKAVDYAIDFAKLINAHLSFITVNVVSEKEISAEYAFWDSVVTSAADSQLHQMMSPAEAKAKAAGLSAVDYIILHGRNIASTLVEYASQKGYDQIVIGSEGLTGIQRVILGSVAEAVIKKAHCPVTVVR